jgi:hypothetical protein
LHSEHPAPSAVCSFSVTYLLFRFFCFFFCEAGFSLSRRLCWFISGVAVGILHAASLLTCWSGSPKQVWSQCLSVQVTVTLFSQCNMVWRSFVQAEGSGCQSFDSFWCFFSAKCGSSISAKFLISGAHTFCFCPLVAILDPPMKFYKNTC